MALLRPTLIKLLVPLAGFALTVGLLSLMNRSSAPAVPKLGGGEGFGATARSTDARIKALQAALRSNPTNADGFAVLGNAYLQKVRETGDSAYYVRAQAVLQRALEHGPHDAAALAGMGSL